MKRTEIFTKVVGVTFENGDETSGLQISEEIADEIVHQGTIIASVAIRRQPS